MGVVNKLDSSIWLRKIQKHKRVRSKTVEHIMISKMKKLEKHQRIKQNSNQQRNETKTKVVRLIKPNN